MRTRWRSNWREEDARRALEEVEERCESDLAFARRTGIPASRLRWWRKRLGFAGGESLAMQLLPVCHRSPETA